MLWSRGKKERLKYKLLFKEFDNTIDIDHTECFKNKNQGRNMFKDVDMIQIRKLNKDELIEFCSHWDSSVFIPDNEENENKFATWESLPILATAQEKDYRKRRLSDGWCVLDHRNKDVCFINDEKERCRAHGSTVQISTSMTLAKPVLSSLDAIGEISIGGTVSKADNLADTLQVCLDSGAKKVLLPITSAADLGTVPSELVGRFNLIFYQSAEDAVFKALGVE